MVVVANSECMRSSELSTVDPAASRARLVGYFSQTASMWMILLGSSIV